MPANVVFNSPDTEKSFTFSATADDDNDDGESVKLGFDNSLPTGVSAGTTNEAIVSITDDDVPSVTVSFEQGSYTVAEGNTVTVKVKLSEDPERTVTIPLTKAGQGGASASDYSGVPANVVFNASDTEKSITFSATSDSDNDDGESVKLTFGSTLPAGVTEGSTKEAVVSITDDDVPSVTVSFEQDSYTVAEGNTVTVKVTLSEDPERTVTIPLTKANQDGASSADYSGVPANVVFNASDTEKSITFSAASDSDNDDGESVKLTFGSPLPAGVTEGSTKEAVVSITDDDVPSVTVSFEQDSYTVDEGSTVTVKVTLSEDPERTVTIPLTKAGQGGATSADYSGVPANVVFNASDTEKSFTFTATADDANDDDESVKLGFDSLPAGVTEGSTKEAVVSITDDDVPSVTVSFEQDSYTVDEGSTVTVKVTLSEDPERTVTIPLTKEGQGGATSADYSGVPANVVFNASDTEKSITFSATSDSDNDDGESVKLTFGSTLPAGVTEGSTKEAVVSITDDDLPAVTVSFEQGSYTVAEGGAVTVKVKLDADPERTVTIPLTKANQDGASNSDYSGVPANVVFNASDTVKSFTFTATADDDNDDGESVKLGFDNSLPTGVSAGTTNEAIVSITDDDVPSVTVSFEQGSYTVAEGNTVTVKVTLSEDPERTVTIPLTKEGQGGATSADYSGVPANVVFNASDTEKSITFSAASDSDNDDGESVKLTFGSTLPAGVTEGSTKEAVVSITDDDVPSVTVSFEQDSYTVAEGNTVTVKVTLSEDPERTVTIPLTKEGQGGATSADYSGVPANVVFNASDTEKSITFSATSDSDNDDGESVKLTFGSTLPAGVTEGSTKEAVVSITDDDLPAVTVSFEQGSYTVAEGGAVTVKVKLDADPERTVTIPLTKANQDGASNSDYSGVPANVVFNANDTEKSFTFTATADDDNDDGESVKLGFDTLPAGVSAGTTNEAIVSITDDDVPSVTVSFEQDSYTVAEGGAVTVKVKLDADPERTVTIPLMKEGQGGATSADYSGVPANVVFNASDTEKSITFSAASDSDNDDGESVKLTFGSPLPAGVTEGSTKEAVVSITDDDVPSVEVSFEQGSYTVAEGNTVTVKVKLSEDPERTVTIPLMKEGQGGATSADYSGVPANVVFNASDTEKSFTFTATADDDNDDGESVKLTFGSPLPTGVTEGSTKEAVVSITDDDVPAVTVSFEQDSYTVAEGNTVTVKVTLSEDPERTVTIPISKANQDGASSADYSGVPANVVFNDSDTEKSITFSAASDSDNDDGESVKLTFGSTLPAGVTEGSTKEAVVSITDDDLPSVTVSFEQGSYTVAEGNTVTVKVTLSEDPERTVTIPISKAGQGGASASDYSGVPANVVFNASDTEKSFTFTATADDDNDDGESVKLGFDTLPTGVSAGTTNEAIVSITDDDVPSVTVSFEQDSYTVAEGSTVTVKVKLDADPERTVTIPLMKEGQGGATSADYSGVPANVVFNASDTEKSITFSAASDSDNDDGESVKLTFGSPLPAGVTEGSTKEAVVSITDDDVPSVEVSFEQGSYTVAEGNTVTVKVKLSEDPERTVTIPLTKEGQGGATSADYSGVPANVVFNSPDTEKSFTFTAAADSDNDDGESVKLTFGSTLPAGVTEGSTKEAVVSITDDDLTAQTQVSVQVSFNVSGYILTEGGTTDITVKLSADPERSVSIPVTTTDGTGATSDDYSGVPVSVDFASGDTEKSFTFTAAQDAIDENLEEVTLGFGTLPSGVSTASPAQSVVAISDSIHVSFEESYYEAYEGGAGAEVTVNLDGPALTETVIPITATGMDGASSADWTGVPASVTFDAGDTEKSFTVMAYDDTVEDDGEAVELSFDTLPPGVARGNPAIATVELMNMETTRAQIECPDDSGRRILLNRVEEITQEGQSQFLRVKLDPQRVYLIEVYGNRSPSDIVGDDTYSENLTLRAPRVLAVWNEDRTQKLQGRDSGNQVELLRGSVPSGWHWLEITGNGSTGTYRIKVRVNNICITSNGFARYPWFGGPDGYVFDAPAHIYSSETPHHTSRNPLIHQDWGTGSGFLGDNWDWYWDEIPDVDWHEWDVDQTGQTYEIDIWASEKYPGIHQATDLEIKGIYDDQGDLLEGTSGSGTGSRVTITFEPSDAGKYYIAVGSGATDRTGMYEIKIVKPG